MVSGHLIIIVDDSCNQNILNVGPGLSLTVQKGVILHSLEVTG